jgi:signal transduction histidine kinase
VISSSASGIRSADPRWSSWPSLWRGGLLTLVIVFVLSTQLLFQLGLYESWPLEAILLGWLDHFTDQLIVGACIFATVAVAGLAPVNSAPGRIGLLVASIALGAVVGELVVMLRLPLPSGTSAAAALAAKTARWLVIAGLVYAFFVLQRAGAEAASQAHEKELQRIRLEHQMTEARLQSLHAQIEPHFLFNTLANVQRLYRTEPERGRKMLSNFLAYLRAALPQMRNSETTLRQELELARAYLEVLRERMGERLKVTFDVPIEYASLPFPPFALSTLTENAVKHGLNSLPEGGAIEIRARVENRMLRVDVADTGAGLRSSSGTGTGLANLRARLAALYGESAGLEFKGNTPRGICATIVVPVEAPSS